MGALRGIRVATFATLVVVASSSCRGVLGIDAPRLGETNMQGGAAGSTGASVEAAAGVSGDASAGTSDHSASAGESGEGGTPSDAPHPCGALRDSHVVLEGHFRQVDTGQANLPREIDLSQKFPPPGDQGPQQSGVAWAAAYAIKSFQEAAEGKWSIGNDRYRFSPAWVFNQIRNLGSLGEEEGAYPSMALDLIVRSGCDTLKFFPYDPQKYGAVPDPSSIRRAARFKSASWSAVAPNVGTFKELLAAGEAILVTLEVHPDFDELSVSNSTFDSLTGSSRGRQAVVVVGYDDDRGSFSFINSWGPEWGLSGYGRISYELVPDPLLALDAYTLADTANAPPAVDESIFALQRGRLGWVDSDFGDAGLLPSEDLSDVKSIAALNDGVYVLRDRWLERVSIADGSVVTLGGPDWAGPTAITVLSNRLYIVQDASLFEVNPVTGTFVPFPLAAAGWWADAVALASLDNWLYGLQAGFLWRVDPGNGGATPIGTKTWKGITRMAAANGSLFLTEGTGIIKVEPSTGLSTAIPNEGWSRVNAIVGHGGRLYVGAENGLWEVGLGTGVSELMNAAPWDVTTQFAAVPPSR